MIFPTPSSSVSPTKAGSGCPTRGSTGQPERAPLAPTTLRDRHATAPATLVARSDAAVRTCSLVWHKAAQAGGEFVAQDGCSRHHTRRVAGERRLGAAPREPASPPPPHPTLRHPKSGRASHDPALVHRRLCLSGAITEANERHAQPVMTVAHVDPHHPMGRRDRSHRRQPVVETDLDEQRSSLRPRGAAERLLTTPRTPLRWRPAP